MVEKRKTKKNVLVPNRVLMEDFCKVTPLPNCCRQLRRNCTSGPKSARCVSDRSLSGWRGFGDGGWPLTRCFVL